MNLTMRCGLGLRQASLLLRSRVSSPQLGLEAGEFEGRFYLLDFVTNRLERLTLGAYQHLRQAWQAEHFCNRLQNGGAA